MFWSSQFTLPEILSLLGLVQCLYVLAYMLMRSGSIRNALIPSLYFCLMGAAFSMDGAAARWGDDFSGYEQFQWLFWFAGTPVGALLILQIADITHEPKGKYFFLLLLIPITFLPGYFMDDLNVIYVMGIIVGALSLLAIWLRRDLLDGLRSDNRFGKERFWLIMALISLNAAFLSFTFVYLSQGINDLEWRMVRNLLGISFVYIAATSLFRIYPQVLRLKPSPTSSEGGILGSENNEMLMRLNTLFHQDKIYQDAAYGRTELARELGIGEATLSKLINVHFGKTIPQLLNDFRVQDAQKLLMETNVPIQNVFEESGFNSITTFNRVFKELTGESPTEYRTRHKL